MKKFLTLLLVSISFLITACDKDKKTDEDEIRYRGGEVTERVIYGDDDRLDLFEVTDPLHLELARSTAALMKNMDVSDQGNGFSKIKAEKFGDAYGMCADEPYIDQPNPAFCSGFLVAPNIMVTAGHCLQSARDCSNTKFVFDFAVFSAGDYPEHVPSSSVYSCAEVIAAEYTSGTDYSVVRLDRPVLDRNPLQIRQTSEVIEGEGILVIGHPVGLPTKVATGAVVRDIKADYFSANLDTYGGNSGSAVFNAQTGLVEGILVRGETDFIWDAGCRRSNECSDLGCRGEDVTKISEVLAHLPAFIEQPTANEGDYELTFDQLNLAITDYSTQPAQVEFQADQIIGNRALMVMLDIEHTWIGDLIVQLVSPLGDVYVLHSRSGGNQENIVRGYTLTDENWLGASRTPISEQLGTWTLLVNDRAPQDIGQIRSVSLVFKD